MCSRNGTKEISCLKYMLIDFCGCADTHIIRLCEIE